MTVVLDHVLDTVQHLLKKKVALERAVDPDTPDIIADGSRIVQVRLHPEFAAFLLLIVLGSNSSWGLSADFVEAALLLPAVLH